MKRILIAALMVLPSLTLFAQSKLVDQPKNPVSTAVDRPPVAATADPSYTIGPEDVINIAVWKEPDFTATVPVRPDGKISLQLIGDVQAAGKTPAVLADDLTALLKKYIAEPRVTVMVTTINSRRVFLLGEITRPGPIVITAGMTVLQAIAAAGGPTVYANSKKIYVLRTENGHETRFPFNYKEALKGGVGGQNIPLKPGDTIVVP
jgi:polysaccharide biosynthesis/export protein